MRRLGPPTVLAVECEDHYFALEGTHRIEAARLLRLPVILSIVAADQLLPLREMDIAESWENPPAELLASDCVAYLRAPCNGEYRINPDGTVQLVRAAKYPPVPPL